jgi:hypothetical protein
VQRLVQLESVKMSSSGTIFIKVDSCVSVDVVQSGHHHHFIEGNSNVDIKLSTYGAFLE